MANKVTLYVMCAEDMYRAHPETNWEHKCSKCGREVGIYPSGQQVMVKMETELICNRCTASVQGGEIFHMPAGPTEQILREILESKEREP